MQRGAGVPYVSDGPPFLSNAESAANAAKYGQTRGLLCNHAPDPVPSPDLDP